MAHGSRKQSVISFGMHSQQVKKHKNYKEELYNFLVVIKDGNW